MDKNVEKKIMDLEKRVMEIEKKIKITTTVTMKRGGKRKESINEFLREKKPNAAVDKVLFVAYFYEKDSGADSFNAEDLRNLIRKAKEITPKNINDLINKNINKGLIAEDENRKDGKKSWYVTNSGVTSVEG